jgi:hypothetical protein
LSAARQDIPAENVGIPVMAQNVTLSVADVVNVPGYTPNASGARGVRRSEARGPNLVIR